jgi:hypothetical protein
MRLFSKDVPFYIQFHVDQQIWRTAMYENVAIIRNCISNPSPSSREIVLLLKLVEMVDPSSVYGYFI